MKKIKFLSVLCICFVLMSISISADTNINYFDGKTQQSNVLNSVNNCDCKKNQQCDCARTETLNECDCIKNSPNCDCRDVKQNVTPILKRNKTITINVTGQGVAPLDTISPAQAFALAKRAAIGDAYRLIAEKVKGVYVEGQDLVKNMIVKRSTVRTSVEAMVRNANIVETKFQDGLCEVEMEITVCYSDFMYPGSLHHLQ